MNPFMEHADTPAPPETDTTAAHARPPDDEGVTCISIDDIARKLLRENFYLTALELHCELCELGAELPRLRNFFSNPGNFERQMPFKPELAGQLSSTNLRKSHSRSSSQATLDSIDMGRFSEDGERLQDERYAVLEFELRKANDTIKSLRANLTGATELSTPDQGGDRPTTDDEPIKPHEQRALNFLINEYLLRHGYKLSSIAFSDENEDQDVEDWDDVGLNVAKPPELLHFFREGGARPASSVQESDVAEAAVTAAVDVECQTEPDHMHQNLQNDSQLLREQIQLLESQLSALQSSAPTVELTSSGDRDDSLESEMAATESQNRLNCLRETSLASQPSADETTGSSVPELFRSAVLSACLSEPSSGGDGALDRLQREVAEPCVTAEQALLQLARCLPHIVPNVILAKREELIPLLLSAVRLHPDARQRDVLLNLLFNLIKRPDAQQRAVILSGFGALAARLAPGRLEEEVLPQCWEQISHKYPERRLLVAEACAVLAPALPPELRGSLVWSMLHQMVTDEREDSVREAAVRAMAVVLLHCDDADKFNQVWELTSRLLVDRCEAVQRTTAELLLPVVARWALQLQQLHLKLMPQALAAAQRAAQAGVLLQAQPADGTVTIWLQTLSTLLDHAFLWVWSAGPHRGRSESDQLQGVSDSRLPPAYGPLGQLTVLHGQPAQLRHLVAEYDNYVSQEWYQVWPALEWVLGASCFGALVRLSESLPLALADAVCEVSRLWRHLAHLAGPAVTEGKLWPLCESRLRAAEAEEGSPPGLTSPLLPAVCAGLLSVPHPQATGRLARTLEDALYLSAACRLSGEPLAVAVRLLLDQPERHTVLLDLVWKGVMHAVTEVRETTAELTSLLVPCVTDVTLTSRVLPALVTLASDPQPPVRRAAVPALGLVLETRAGREPCEKARLQLAALAADPALAVLLVRALGRAAAAGRHADFCLPQLAAIADRRAAQEAVPLLDAYTALACGHVEPAAVQRHVLPALRCVVETLAAQSMPQADVAAALVRDYEHRAWTPPPTLLSPTQAPSGAVPAVQQGMEDVRNRVTKMLSSTSIQSKSSQLTGLFKKK